MNLISLWFLVFVFKESSQLRKKFSSVEDIIVVWFNAVHLAQVSAWDHHLMLYLDQHMVYLFDLVKMSSILEPWFQDSLTSQEHLVYLPYANAFGLTSVVFRLEHVI